MKRRCQFNPIPASSWLYLTDQAAFNAFIEKLDKKNHRTAYYCFLYAKYCVHPQRGLINPPSAMFYRISFAECEKLHQQIEGMLNVSRNYQEGAHYAAD